VVVFEVFGDDQVDVVVLQMVDHGHDVFM
jgi:hypothetical protein